MCPLDQVRHIEDWGRRACGETIEDLECTNLGEKSSSKDQG